MEFTTYRDERCSLHCNLNKRFKSISFKSITINESLYPIYIIFDYFCLDSADTEGLSRRILNCVMTT